MIIMCDDRKRRFISAKCRCCGATFYENSLQECLGSNCNKRNQMISNENKYDYEIFIEENKIQLI